MSDFQLTKKRSDELNKSISQASINSAHSKHSIPPSVHSKHSLHSKHSVQPSIQQSVKFSECELPSNTSQLSVRNSVQHLVDKQRRKSLMQQTEYDVSLDEVDERDTGKPRDTANSMVSRSGDNSVCNKAGKFENARKGAGFIEIFMEVLCCRGRFGETLD